MDGSIEGKASSRESFYAVFPPTSGWLLFLFLLNCSCKQESNEFSNEFSNEYRNRNTFDPNRNLTIIWADQLSVTGDSERIDYWARWAQWMPPIFSRGPPAAGWTPTPAMDPARRTQQPDTRCIRALGKPAKERKSVTEKHDPTKSIFHFWSRSATESTQTKFRDRK